jgi:hypothetical protein
MMISQKADSTMVSLAGSSGCSPLSLVSRDKAPPPAGAGLGDEAHLFGAPQMDFLLNYQKS